MTPRSVPEWIAKHPDQQVPPHVRLRIFDREGGRCHLSGRKIMPGDLWDLDHKIALINGGEHRESNLFPALRDKHRQKTAEDVAEKAATARVRSKHLGIKKPRNPMPGSKASPYRKRMDGTVERRR
jgi:5-methylcytosine-specific restriction endonuclease McrA